MIGRNQTKGLLLIPFIALAPLTGCRTINRILYASNWKSWEGEEPADLALTKVLAAKKKVSLAVILNCTTTFSDEYIRYMRQDRAQWTASCITLKQSGLEGKLFAKFGSTPNFVFVDRSSLSKIYDELALSAKLDISDETRNRIGNLTGASHIYMAHFTRSENGPNIVDHYAERLVDVETGSVLASQTHRHEYRP